MPTILLADDDKAICTVLEQAVREQGFSIRATGSGEQLLSWVEAGEGNVVITDVLMPGLNGLDLLQRIKDVRQELPVIVISAQNTLMTAVRANQLGATEYLPKPFDLNELLSCIEKHASILPDSAPLPEGEGTENPLIGRSPAMQEIYRIIGRLVNVDLTVLIEGESGTGKELIARALHQLGPRKGKPFVAVNMAAIPRELIESELFGHEKGAFTGAANRKAGKFEQAEGGTLFLDEIGDMPMEAQTRLLRVLQQGEYSTIGGNRTHRTNVRIICATHRDLGELTKTGQFREDLFYRLNVVPIRVPPLRERREDIGELTQFFLKKARDRGLPDKNIAPEALAALKQYGWPGNVRELENLIYRLVVVYSEPIISNASVSQELLQRMRGEATTPSQDQSLSDLVTPYFRRYFQNHQPSLPAPGVYERIIGIVEKSLIDITLEATRGNQIRAAQILGINRNTLRKKIQDAKRLENV